MPDKKQPQADAVRSQVATITASSGFSNTERLSKFLQFIVEETLAGRSDQLKEYVIGTQVYGRRAGYDPRTDATVRVEAAKLRKRLGRYYEGEGRTAPVVISVPKGCYRPEFEDRGDGPGVASPVRARYRWSLIPAIGLSVLLLVAGLAIARWMAHPPRWTRQRLISTFAGSHQSATFSPDGAMIAFVSGGDGTEKETVPQVWVKDVAEGPPIQITFGDAAAAHPAWSSRGGEIVFERRGQGVWAASPLGGDSHRIIEDGRLPGISPDGSRLLFVRRRELWISQIDGASPRRVDGVPERFLPMQTRPAFSPDGRWIAFFNAEVGPLGDVWVIASNGGRARQVTFDQAEVRGLAWSSDSQRIIYSSARAGSFTLWQVPLAGGNPESITSGAGEDLEPAISSDGRKLIYTNARTTRSLMLFDPTSGIQKELLTQRETIGFPAFSPDGDRIAFFQPVNGDPHLFLLQTDGRGRQQVSYGGGRQILPTWSYDGLSLYYYQIKPERSFRKLELSGGNSVKIADWAYGKENWARVDPRGQRAVYTTVGPKGPQTSTVRELASGRERPLAATLTRLEWSADGRFILGESGSRENGSARVTICGADNNECTEITAGMAPKWSADGLRIYYLRPAGQSDWFDLWNASRKGEGAQKIATLGPFRGDEIHFDVSREGRILWAPSRHGRQELWLSELE